MRTSCSILGCRYIQHIMKTLLDKLYQPIVACGVVQEIRLVVGQAVQVLAAGRWTRLPLVADRPTLIHMLAVATEYSVYAACDKMVQGYLPYRGGIRIGIAGDYVTTNGKLLSLGTITGMTIRVPHAVPDCSACLPMGRIKDKNVLVVSPPCGGKTTFVRDLAVRLSACGNVVILDERGEISGGFDEAANRYLLGVGTSMVLSGSAKSLVAGGVVRALSPRYIVCDELMGQDDLATVRALIAAGIKVVATVHAASAAGVSTDLLHCFDVVVVLSAVPAPGSVVEARYA